MQNNSRKTLLRALAAAIGFSAALPTAARPVAAPPQKVARLRRLHSEARENVDRLAF